MNQAALALGSNIPPRKKALREALDRLHRLPDTCLLSLSRIYETAPVGGPAQGDYLNAAVLVETGMEPRELLAGLNGIEKEMGRNEKGGCLPRVIDLDIIFYGDRIIDSPGLSIPHPRFRERGFVLQPLTDIIPAFIDPVTTESVESILDAWIRSGGEPVNGTIYQDFGKKEGHGNIHNN